MLPGCLVDCRKKQVLGASIGVIVILNNTSFLASAHGDAVNHLNVVNSYFLIAYITGECYEAIYM